MRGVGFLSLFCRFVLYRYCVVAAVPFLFFLFVLLFCCFVFFVVFCLLFLFFCLCVCLLCLCVVCCVRCVLFVVCLFVICLFWCGVARLLAAARTKKTTIQTGFGAVGFKKKEENITTVTERGISFINVL